MHRHNTIVLRNSDEEITFAEVSCDTVEVMTDDELRDAISGAIQCWRRESDEGKAAWTESSEDFNVGDLVDYVEFNVEPNLERQLEIAGVHNIHIETHSFHAYQPTPWSYDDVLGG